MKLVGRILLTTFLSFLTVFLFLGQGYAKPTCGILWFYPNGASADFEETRYITNRYTVLLDQLNIYDVISPEMIEQTIDNDELVDSCKEKACAIDIGKKIDADYMIYGILGHVGSLYSLDTSFVNVETGSLVNSSVTDLEGTPDEFVQKAPPHNIRSLLNVQQTPPDWGAAPTEPTEKVEKPSEEAPEPASSKEPAPEPEEEKAFYFGPRIGFAATDDGSEAGIGFEVRSSNLSFMMIGSDAGIAGALSYYLHDTGNSPFLSITGAYYDDEEEGVDEIGRVYGLVAGYRYCITDQLDIRGGIGAAYFNWDQTEAPRKEDEEFAPVAELTLGYMF